MAEEAVRYSVYPRVLIFVFKNNKLLMMKYSGKGEHMTKEKEERKDIYNCIGGHVEEGENVVESAVKEASEEAGIKLLNPKIRGIINVNGFAGKNVMNFIVSGTTQDEPRGSTLEGELVWINPEDIENLNVFPDMSAILEKLSSLMGSEIFVGTAKFEGFKLQNISLHNI